MEYNGLIKLAQTTYLDNESRSSLHKILGYDSNDRIPKSVFDSIMKAKIGAKVGKVKVTDSLKSKVKKALSSRAKTPKFGHGKLEGRRLFGK